MRHLRGFAVAGLALGLSACNLGGRAAAPAPTAATTGPAVPHVSDPVTRGEKAPFVVEGDVVHVNNHLCGVSRSAMGPETLGRFVSRVVYQGADPRFQGKTFEFNQCCGGCLAKFPELWAQHADEILAFHGVDLPSRTMP
jgi:hypothetical protein